METHLHYIGANGNTIDMLHNGYFQTIHADGLTRLSANIASSTTPNVDGDRINNVWAQPRGIVLDLRIRGNVDVEEAKRYVLQTIKPTQTGRLVLTQGDRVLEIEGCVESINMPRFGRGVTMQVSLHCSEPYWHDLENVLLEISRTIAMHYFPDAEGGLYIPAGGIVISAYDTNMTRTYTNDGDAACGMVISIVALGAVQNPVIYMADGTYIGVNDSMIAGDEIIINTNAGQKGITKNGVNILNRIRPGSKFFQLETGDNVLTIGSDGNTAGNVYFTLSFRRRFV